ncbi:Glypican-6 precursor, putative [Pediculus humanus corporis]|uniref:Glypican-6, putative n=1 Tax=Pediculus humanus subsp. corporis TaxID=121224 RepID=E0VMJ1_PEDHC|nr:Glypican-6 precursor, putative [Pediculus humanus corporis]EEB14597.1 Glypican-6 precursor, putative [Pediculus humanus corporis]
MFKKTYGIIYEQNSFVFTDLFEELERYYLKGQIDLEEAMENFFTPLYQKMFTVLNSQYQFDDKYLICIGDHMKDLKPFGDVPQKLSVQIKRSFVATRTFAQALNLAKDIVNNMKNLGAAGDCHDAFFRMSQCQACKGVPDLKPCTHLCLNVMKGCLAYQMGLEDEWNHFVDALDKVSDRLLGPFNIEVVVEPINIKISEAIMNFQENSLEVSERVFNGCGRLSLRGRSRRDMKEIQLETYEFAKESHKITKSPRHPTLEKLIRDIRQKVKDSKSFWSYLPYHLCNNEKFAVVMNDDPCWNGSAVGRYTREAVDNGLSNQQNNPEVTVDTTKPKSILNEQIYSLKILTSKLKNAYNGMDVDWIDTEDSSSADIGSGEGSGEKDVVDVEGSGESTNDLNNDYDKKETKKIFPFIPLRPVSSNEGTNSVSKNEKGVLPKYNNGNGHFSSGRSQVICCLFALFG